MSKARDIARAGTALANVDATELGYLDGVTSNVQTQVDSKTNKSGDTFTGNVGVGTGAGITTVASGLAINNATAGNYPGLEIQTAGTTRMYFNANNAASYIASVGTSPLVTYTNGAERMRIDSAGKVNINSATAVGTPITSIKQSAETNAFSGLQIQRNVDDSSIGVGYDSTKASFDIRSDFASTGSSKPLTFTTGGTERMRIALDGATTVTYTTTTGGAVRNIYMSTSTPSGGSDGDVWIQYT